MLTGRMCERCGSNACHAVCQSNYEVFMGVASEDSEIICYQCYCDEVLDESAGRDHMEIDDAALLASSEDAVDPTQLYAGAPKGRPRKRVAKPVILDSSDDDDDHQGNVDQQIDGSHGHGPTVPNPGEVQQPPLATTQPGDQKPSNQQPEADLPWYSGMEAQPEISHATTIQDCRLILQEWGRRAGFNLVTKSGDKIAGKWTFVCGCKGRKAESNSDTTLDPDDQRATNVQYALPGEDMCPFR